MCHSYYKPFVKHFPLLRISRVLATYFITFIHHLPINY